MLKQARVYFKILVNRVAHGRNRYINDKKFLILIALFVGLFSGLAAVFLKNSVHLLQSFLEGGFNVRYENYLYLVYPLIGILLSVLYVRLFHKGKEFDKGLSSVIYSISRKGSAIPGLHVFSQIITSVFTVGFGGSVGLEAPIAVTGSAIGSNTAKDLLMNRQQKTLLLACGAASGISAIFNSPIAGVVFAFEVLLSEVSVPAFIPLLMSSATGAVVSRLFQSHQVFFLTTNSWSMRALPYYVLLGAFCGLTSVYMIRNSLATEHFFNNRKNPWLKALAGGLLIGALLFLFPPLYGEGYNSISMLMSGDYHSLPDKSLFYRYHENEWFVLLFIGVIILLKVFASSITIGSGEMEGFLPLRFSQDLFADYSLPESFTCFTYQI